MEQTEPMSNPNDVTRKGSAMEQRATPLRGAATVAEILDAPLVESWPADLTDAIAIRAGRAVSAGHLHAAAGIAAQVAATYYAPLAARVAQLEAALENIVDYAERSLLSRAGIIEQMADEARTSLAKVSGVTAEAPTP
jgi:hypothetical protein